MIKSLNIGGVVAIGFDSTNRYALVISHDGRGVFDMTNWERVARDYAAAYPNDGFAMGLGPIAGQLIHVEENDFSGEPFIVLTPDRRLKLTYQTGIVEIETV